MVEIVVQRIIRAPIAEVWASWDDYANIHLFHPGVRSSYLLGEKQKTGKGALRQCDFTDGKTFLKERIIHYEDQRRITVEIYDTNAPIKNPQADFEFQELDSFKTRVVMTMQFTPKLGIIGKLLTPIMKMQFTKGLQGLLDGNASYVETKLLKKHAA
ncbi:SRPBCC family protein [Curvivirga sp.]|uniref:SRPBCC family protein n=1 Tax=Curvivirga sp. TaxID=2856848 RepID=UPI003B5B1FE7